MVCVVECEDATQIHATPEVYVVDVYSPQVWTDANDVCDMAKRIFEGCVFPVKRHVEDHLLNYKAVLNISSIEHFKKAAHSRGGAMQLKASTERSTTARINP